MDFHQLFKTQNKGKFLSEMGMGPNFHGKKFTIVDLTVNI